VQASLYDVDQESSPSSCGSLSEASSTPAGSSTCYDSADVVSLDLDGWSGSNWWHPNDGSGVQYEFDSGSVFVGQSHDDGDWPALQIDDWPCFPG
jgi:hypothetical protein